MKNRLAQTKRIISLLLLSVMLVVPHECPEVPALRRMPVIMYYDDTFTEPDFKCDLIVEIDDVIDVKLQIAHLNASQVYEWLPYTKGLGEEDGVLIAEQGNVEAFGALLESLMESRERLEALGEKAYKHSQQYTVPAICKRWEELFESLTNKK